MLARRIVDISHTVRSDSTCIIPQPKLSMQWRYGVLAEKHMAYNVSLRTILVGKLTLERDLEWYQEGLTANLGRVGRVLTLV